MDAKRLILLAEAILAQDFGAGIVVPEKLYALIPTAIKAAQNKLIESNPAKLENFRAEFIVSPKNGVADLSQETSEGLRLDLFTGRRSGLRRTAKRAARKACSSLILTSDSSATGFRTHF